MNVGIIGSGQLGYMMINEGRKLNNRYYVLNSNGFGPASSISDGSFDNDSYKEFVDKCDIVTFEFEHVNEEALKYAESIGKLRPSLRSVELKKDRELEKNFLSSNGIAVADFRVAETFSEAKRYAKDYGKAMIKRAYGGYDGKGQVLYDHGKTEEMQGEKFVVEEFINYDFEASIIASRGSDGTVNFHDPSFNYNSNAIFIYNRAPIDDYGMKAISEKIMNALEYVGVMGIEFYIKGGKAIVNEYAPRVHNSGHHTLMGSSISQFEEHIRAISDLKISKLILYEPSGSINVLGKKFDKGEINSILSLGETQIYWYGKEEIRKRRKVGHVNVTDRSIEGLKRKTEKILDILYGGNINDFISF
ncbi:MAG: 5-(carboxyamino)imidazole ribonucleotide synthase [Thermoplasmata archaeon]